MSDTLAELERLSERVQGVQARVNAVAMARLNAGRHPLPLDLRAFFWFGRLARSTRSVGWLARVTVWYLERRFQTPVIP